MYNATINAVVADNRCPAPLASLLNIYHEGGVQRIGVQRIGVVKTFEVAFVESGAQVFENIVHEWLMRDISKDYKKEDFDNGRSRFDALVDGMGPCQLCVLGSCKFLYSTASNEAHWNI